MNRSLVAGALACLLLLPACTRQSKPSAPASMRQPAVFSQCVRISAPAKPAGINVAETTANAAIFGGLGGAVVGLVATGRPLGVAVGSIAGMVGGTIFGFSYASFYNQTDKNKRNASIRITANQDIANLNSQQLRAYDNLRCHIQWFEKSRASLAQGLTTRDAFRLHYSEIRAGMQTLAAYVTFLDEELDRTRNELHQLTKPEGITSAPGTRSPKRQNNRSLQDIVADIAPQQEHIRALQQSNDDDLTEMLDAYADKAILPQQDLAAIQRKYTASYADAKMSMQTLRESCRLALEKVETEASQAERDTI